MQADNAKISRLLKTARGQMDGILKMVEEDRYCVDISNQIMATEAILKKVNKEVLKSHVNCCLREAAVNGDIDGKLAEIEKIMDSLGR
ncbi:metal-sensing transcriptional repressor [Anaerobium acetethylicum]|uniref:DNA-binding transcriptional regulator, FrmR family n=1 Tax=Anaerobium acetethylicum TaxID=1619234 RepID=A0A1D3TNH8_9FIRM|nr:metal-sensing transcriptional repressor [Anaerobium acetethylicum]SCP94872.1 DNA-binding transcriptional regulator, FrmR family [Anaerobium acetethylicum]